MHMYITLTINSCNATSDLLEQEECITKLMQAALIFWYKYQKIELILIIHYLLSLFGGKLYLRIIYSGTW